MSASFIFMFSSRGFAQEQRPSHFFFVSGVSREQIRVIHFVNYTRSVRQECILQRVLLGL